MTETEALVFVIDDDAAMREALQSLIRSVGLGVATFSSAREFLNAQRPDAPACLVLDVRLPGPSGLDLQRELAEAEIHLPIIFITGHGDIPMTVRAMKAGAVEFLTKPFRDQDLLDAIAQALDRDRVARAQRAELATLRERYESLTPREREVLGWVAAGKTNAQIGEILGTMPRTVAKHLERIYEKLGVETRTAAAMRAVAVKRESSMG